MFFITGGAPPDPATGDVRGAVEVVSCCSCVFIAVIGSVSPESAWAKADLPTLTRCPPQAAHSRLSSQLHMMVKEGCNALTWPARAALRAELYAAHAACEGRGLLTAVSWCAELLAGLPCEVPSTHRQPTGQRGIVVACATLSPFERTAARGA